MQSRDRQTLDDLVALLGQGQVTFGDAEFSAAAAEYRNGAAPGKHSRRQVNLAACLYLQAKGEPITLPRVTDLGGWGQRNTMLQDIADFVRHGERPSTTTTAVQALASTRAPARSVMETAISQGIAAAEQILEANLRTEYEERLARINEVADLRVHAADQRAAKANELKESAQAQAQLLEQRYDALLQTQDELKRSEASAVARADELSHQVTALSRSVSEANSRANGLEADLADLRRQLSEAFEEREATRKSHLLALDQARHANDQNLSKLTSAISSAHAEREVTQAKAAAAEALATQLKAANSVLQAELEQVRKALTSQADMNKRLVEAIARGAGEARDELKSGIQSVINALGNAQEAVLGVVSGTEKRILSALEHNPPEKREKG